MDRAEFERAVEAATAQVITDQLAAGIDIGNDGEQVSGELCHLCPASDVRVRGLDPAVQKRDLSTTPTSWS